MTEGFSNPINAGDDLVIPMFQSPNYVPGVSGWAIFRNGHAEFNDVTIRDGDIISGTSLDYSGTPASGNLIASVAGLPGTDAVGNAYLVGVTSYFNSGGTYYALQQLNASIILWSAASPAGPYASTGYLIDIGTTNIVIDVGGSATQLILDATGTNARNGLQVGTGRFLSTAGTAVSPTLITTDSWNTMTLVSGWTATGGYARYMLMPDNTVMVQALITAGTLTNGTTIWDAPAGYVPSGAPGTQSFPVSVTGATGSPGILTPRIGINSGGVLFIENLPAATTQIAFSATYSLT